jgi:phospholipase/carboxylesterase
MRELNLAGLPVRVAGGADGNGGGEGPLVVLLHGFGAPGDDLASLWRVVDAPAGTRWAFPAAPLILQMGGPASPRGPGPPPDARAWWMIDLDRRLGAAERGQLDSLAREVPEGMREAGERIVSLLRELDTWLRPTKIVLGGFSQGAMLACDVALRTDARLAGVALLSGTLLASDEWAALVSRRHGLPILQSHGTFDPLLPFAYAEKLRDLLTSGGAVVTWVPFRGGHEIPHGVVDALGGWLRAVLD